MENKNTELTVIVNRYTDAGHSWFEIPKYLLKQVLKDISSCSYEMADCLYLEEDCDAKVGLDELRRLGFSKIEFKEIYQDESMVRSYEHFNYRA